MAKLETILNWSVEEEGHNKWERRWEWFVPVRLSPLQSHASSAKRKTSPGSPRTIWGLSQPLASTRPLHKLGRGGLLSTLSMLTMHWCGRCRASDTSKARDLSVSDFINGYRHDRPPLFEARGNEPRGERGRGSKDTMPSYLLNLSLNIKSIQNLLDF